MYREFGLHVTTAILYNHDSPRRHGDYLLHRLCRAAVGKQIVKLSNMDDELSIGCARNYMETVYDLMQLKECGDYVLGTRHTHTLREVVKMVYGEVGLNYGNFVHVVDRMERPGKKQVLVPDTSKLRHAIVFNDEDNLPSIVKSLIEKYRKEV
jgi:GDPmannose 4,6-dehydratase